MSETDRILQEVTEKLAGEVQKILLEKARFPSPEKTEKDVCLAS